LNPGFLSVGEFLLFLNPFLIFHFACFFITKNHCKGQSLAPISWVKYGLFSLTVSYVLYFHIIYLPLFFLPLYFGFFYLCFMLVDAVFNYIQLFIKSKN
jgi:hypothetical protein